MTYFKWFYSIINLAVYKKHFVCYFILICIPRSWKQSGANTWNNLQRENQAENKSQGSLAGDRISDNKSKY